MRSERVILEEALLEADDLKTLEELRELKEQEKKRKKAKRGGYDEGIA